MSGSAAALPTGTVTFLMTDIEGSTRLLLALADAYATVLEQHYRILAEACRSEGGAQVSAQGDATFFVFSDPVAAVRAAFDVQRRLAAHAWPEGADVRVRVGVHTGEGRLAGGDYVGLDVHRVARIMSAGHGGQVLVSDSTRALATGRLPPEVALRDLGEHRLEDLDRPEHLFQLHGPGLASDFAPLHGGAPIRHILPAQLTSFVGRTREKQEVQRLLDANRIVTLTGPGGTGKTRLSLEVADAAASAFEGGSSFVPLAAIRDPDLVVPAIATAVGVRESPPYPLAEALAEHLGRHALLLVLDNFEQLMPAAAALGQLVGKAPRTKLLLTSREPLRIAGEQEYPVPPLEVPDAHAAADPDALLRYDAVALFLRRAASVRPGFELTNETAPAIAQICARLDGLPLAIELAAARVRLFAPDEILARLDRRLSFLAGGRDVTERQRTLRGAIDWSYELLEEPERALFARLSVFAGGCTMEVVEAVCQPRDIGLDAVDGVSSLHDKSLLRRDDRAVGLRVTMLETIRDYAQERLDASGDALEIRRRHANVFASLAESAIPGMAGRDQERVFDALESDLDNFRAAIRWAIDEREIELAVRLVTALNSFWVFRNHLMEGRHLLSELLGDADALPTRLRAAAFGVAADLSSWRADYAAGLPLAEQSLRLFRELGDLHGIAAQLTNMGWPTIISDPARAHALFAESIAAYRQLGTPATMGHALIGIAMPEMQSRQLDAANEHLGEASTLFHDAGDETMAIIADGLGGLCMRLQGRLDDARDRYVDVLNRAETLGAHIALALPLQAFADLALVQGDPERAAILFAAQAAVAERLGGSPGFALMGIPGIDERARAELGDERYAELEARGRAMPLDEVIRFARSGSAMSTSDR